MSDRIDGSGALENPRWEFFAQALSRAAPPSLVDGYFEAADATGCRRPTHNAARVAASNLARKSVVAERVSFLRHERLNGAESDIECIDERRIQDLLATCSETLVSAAKAAEAAGLGAAQVSAIRKSIVVHEGRRLRSHKFIPETPEPIATHNDFPGWCSCKPDQPNPQQSRGGVQ